MLVASPARWSMPARCAGRASGPAAPTVSAAIAALPTAAARCTGRIHLAMVANMPATFSGLEMWSFMPAASASSRSPAMALAVIAMIGSAAKRGCSRSRRVAV